MRLNERTLFRNGLLVGAIVLPAMLYGAVIHNDRRTVVKQTKETISTTVQIFEANIHHLLESDVLIASMINQHIRGWTWEQIGASETLHGYLADIVQTYRANHALWLIDADGEPHNSSAVFPVPPSLSVAEREYFRALREHDQGFFISKPAIGRYTDQPHIIMAQRRISTDNQFDGVIVLTVEPIRFTDYWNKLPRKPGSAILVRTDGQLLARDPPMPVDTPPFLPTSKLMQQINAGSIAGFIEGASIFDGKERIYGYRKVENFPVYVGYGIDIDAALELWYQHIWQYGIFFALGTIGLIALVMLAADRLTKWQDMAHELSNEIVRREQAEVQLRQAQKLEALGQVAGQIAHDFGNILGVIVGSLDMLAQDPAKFLDRAQRAAERGLKAVNTLLAFARRQPEKAETFDVNSALVGLRDLLCQAIGGKIALDLRTGDTPCWIKANRNQTELAILNIVVNARDAMPDGGTITITVTPTGATVTVAITDTGQGMSPEVVARVFEPFYTTKQPGKGTGLGLSMVYSFAQQTGGSVEISSQPEVGTTVTLVLPMSAP